MPTDQEKYSGEKLRNLRKGKGLSIAALANKTGVSKRSLSRYESGETFPGGTNLASLKAFFEGMKDQIQEPGPLSAGPGTPELAEADLLLMEFGAWLRRTVLKYPELTDDIATGIRRLINEVEDKRLPRAAPLDDLGDKAAS